MYKVKKSRNIKEIKVTLLETNLMQKIKAHTVRNVGKSTVSKRVFI